MGIETRENTLTDSSVLMCSAISSTSSSGKLLSGTLLYRDFPHLIQMA